MADRKGYCRGRRTKEENFLSRKYTAAYQLRGRGNMVSSNMYCCRCIIPGAGLHAEKDHSRPGAS